MSVCPARPGVVGVVVGRLVPGEDPLAAVRDRGHCPGESPPCTCILGLHSGGAWAGQAQRCPAPFSWPVPRTSCASLVFWRLQGPCWVVANILHSFLMSKLMPTGPVPCLGSPGLSGSWGSPLLSSPRAWQGPRCSSLPFTPALRPLWPSPPGGGSVFPGLGCVAGCGDWASDPAGTLAPRLWLSLWNQGRCSPRTVSTG